MKHLLSVCISLYSLSLDTLASVNLYTTSVCDLLDVDNIWLCYCATNKRKDILCLKTKTEKSRKEHEKKAKKKSGKNVSKRERMSSLGMPE